MSREALTKRLDEVQRRIVRGMDFGLDRMRAALAALGEPQDRVPSVHVAGTNGKGSTSATIESIARHAGLKTGLYTSPHLHRIAERIRLDGVPIDDDRFEQALAKVIERCAADLTFFETLTLAGFVAFADAEVDLAVIEVGLGGRLDATNTMTAPLATAITSIGFDHTELLGNSLDAIAREKAKIVRPGVPLVVGPVADEAMKAIEEIAAEAGAGPVIRIHRETPFSFSPALEGEHQKDNARVAARVAEIVGVRFPTMNGAIGAGIAGVKWPGRFERLRYRGASVIVDCAHNVEGAQALAAAIRRAGLAPDRTTLVFGALADKDFPAMLAILSPLATRRIFTRPSGRAPAPSSALLAIAMGESIDMPRDAIERAVLVTPPDGAIVIAGSSYLAAEISAHCLGVEADPVIAL